MKRGNKKGQHTPEQLRSTANDAIAFLHSMVKLVDARRWRAIDAQFAIGMFMMAEHILDHSEHDKSNRALLAQEQLRCATAAVSGARELLESIELPLKNRVTKEILTGAVAMVERTVRAGREQMLLSSAKRAA